MKGRSKEGEVATLRQMVESSQGLVLVSSQGMTARDMGVVRRRVREAGGQVRVVRNTLLRLAVKDQPEEALTPYLRGPVTLVAAGGEPQPPTKALLDMKADFPKLEIKAGFFAGRVRSEQEVVAIGNLPHAAQVAGQLVYALQMPLRQLVQHLRWPVVNLVHTLQAAAQKM